MRYLLICLVWITSSVLAYEGINIPRIVQPQFKQCPDGFTKDKFGQIICRGDNDGT